MPRPRFSDLAEEDDLSPAAPSANAAPAAMSSARPSFADLAGEDAAPGALEVRMGPPQIIPPAPKPYDGPEFRAPEPEQAPGHASFGQSVWMNAANAGALGAGSRILAAQDALDSLSPPRENEEVHSPMDALKRVAGIARRSFEQNKQIVTHPLDSWDKVSDAYDTALPKYQGGFDRMHKDQTAGSFIGNVIPGAIQGVLGAAPNLARAVATGGIQSMLGTTADLGKAAQGDTDELKHVAGDVGTGAVLNAAGQKAPGLTGLGMLGLGAFGKSLGLSDADREDMALGGGMMGAGSVGAKVLGRVAKGFKDTANEGREAVRNRLIDPIEKFYNSAFDKHDAQTAEEQAAFNKRVTQEGKGIQDTEQAKEKAFTKDVEALAKQRAKEEADRNAAVAEQVAREDAAKESGFHKEISATAKDTAKRNAKAERDFASAAVRESLAASHDAKVARGEEPSTLERRAKSAMANLARKVHADVNLAGAYGGLDNIDLTPKGRQGIEDLKPVHRERLNKNAEMFAGGTDAAYQKILEQMRAAETGAPASSPAPALPKEPRTEAVNMAERLPPAVPEAKADPIKQLPPEVVRQIAERHGINPDTVLKGEPDTGVMSAPEPLPEAVEEKPDISKLPKEAVDALREKHGLEPKTNPIAGQARNRPQPPPEELVDIERKKALAKEMGLGNTIWARNLDKKTAGDELKSQMRSEKARVEAEAAGRPPVRPLPGDEDGWHTPPGRTTKVRPWDPVQDEITAARSRVVKSALTGAGVGALGGGAAGALGVPMPKAVAGVGAFGGAVKNLSSLAKSDPAAKAYIFDSLAKVFNLHPKLAARLGPSLKQAMLRSPAAAIAHLAIARKHDPELDAALKEVENER